MCRFGGVSLLALLCVIALARPAQAHAVLLATSPGFDEVVTAQPERVVANFSEPVEINFGALRVFDSSGQRVDTDDSDHVEGEPASIAVGLRPKLDDGTYTATYRVISGDAHCEVSDRFGGPALKWGRPLVVRSPSVEDCALCSA
jgi:copper transport protein